MISDIAKKRRFSAAKLILCSALITALLCGCSGRKETPSTEPNSTQDAVLSTVNDTVPNGEQTEPATSATQADPVTLEQVLLKERGIPYDKSDYKKFIGGENIIHEYAEFDCNLDHGYSTTINDLVVSDGKLYRANFNSPLPNGKNIQELGTLPGKDILYWHLTYDGEMGSMYMKDGSGYKISAVPFSTVPLDKTQYSLFNKVYRYASDGKTLEDHTSEYLKADKVYDYGTPMFVFLGDKVSMLFPGKYLDEGTTEWNWYRSMGTREYIAFDLDLSPLGGETPVRLFNQNILMTNCAFYEIIYKSQPTDEKDSAAQLAPDGTVSPYYPAAAHKNCELTLRKITLLSRFYEDVRNISTSHVITDDFTMLPLSEIITEEGYNKYQKYSCNQFFWNYIDQ